MHPLAFLLFPFALLFDGITRLRNFLYDRGIFKSYKSQIPSILVGNLRVGGTGKTPMVEYLIRMLKEEQAIATLSRGYGRKSRGFIQAKEGTNSQEIGDEPFQIFQKFQNEIRVFVGEDRSKACQRIESSSNRPDLLILDDAFQHRAFQAHFSILLSTWSHPFYEDYLLPMGRLRESRAGAKRADVVIVTKCPAGLTSSEKEAAIHHVRKYSSRQTPVLFSTIDYGLPHAIGEAVPFSSKVILFSGIANSEALRYYCDRNFDVLDFVEFGDHHEYDEEDMDKLRRLGANYSSDDFVFLCTEKDGVKVKNLLPNGFLGEIPIFVLPIQVMFSTEDEQKLKKLIQQKVLEDSASA